MNDFNVIVALIGGTILLLGLASERLAKSPFPPTLLALVLGVIVGPAALHLIDLHHLGARPDLLEKAARLALGIGLVGVALRIPAQYPREHWRSMLTLVGLGMPLMWLISTALVYLILALPFWLAALIAAVITPTDPVAASPIVTGAVAEENIPDRLRHAISFDSGANDGLGYLFVFLAFLLLTRPLGDAVSHWILTTILWEVVVATLFGLLLGYLCGKLLKTAERLGSIESDWRLVYTVALALLAVGAGKLINSDEVLVVFAAAAAFAQVVNAKDRQNEEHGQEAINRFFAIPIFVLLGITIPWGGWHALGWKGALLAITLLLLRRPLTLLVLRRFLPEIHNVKDALFVGWFGPIAVAAIYYASLMEKSLGQTLVWDVVSLVACASVVAHGLTGAPFTRWYGRVAGKRSALTRSARDAGPSPSDPQPGASTGAQHGNS